MLVVVAPLAAQRIDWQSRVVLYGDNTEFFTPYRTGETILGGQLTTWLEAATGRRTALRAGFFADRRWGSEQFTDSLKPVLQAAFRGRHTTAVLGTLDAERRHGLLDPLMVSTRELTTPVEYGVQWRERRGPVQGELWLNWQRLNTPEQREAFEAGAVVRVDPVDHLRLELQHLWSHRGGQLFDAGVPVTNNRVTAIGIVATDDLPVVGRATLAVHRLWSDGHLDSATPADRPSTGHGTLARVGIAPWRGWQFWVASWWGQDFSAAAGDANYGSAGQDPGFYRAERRYTELGVARRVAARREGMSLDAEVRWHRIDDERSEAFFDSGWEISYRVVVRAPITVRLR
jgi:hypothetical protein